MNWKGQALPVLLNGLPSKAKADNKTWEALPQPSTSQIVSISPYSQIVCGNYHTPTFLIHGSKDDLIPWEQTKQTHDTLAGRGVKSECLILEDAVHLFDLLDDPTGKGWEAILEGYKFLSSCV